MSDTEVANRLGITVHSYDDLERYDDEAFTALSLQELLSLGRALGVKPATLLFGSAADGLKTSVVPDEITARLTQKMIERHQTAEELSESVGWDVRELLVDSSALWSFNVEGLYDLCKAAGVEWINALPE
jgi:hypothetical protein